MKIDVSYNIYDKDISSAVLSSLDEHNNPSKFHLTIDHSEEIKRLILAHVDISTGNPNENKLVMTLDDARQLLLLLAQFLHQMQPSDINK
ncbi:hypothetical protein [Sporosarcina sp. FSL W7-1283]|uniref:hypothetical protein n=1 Tax=Sporosarcina sp. FSL W7-1283 TaxID=2921560 RepID=UPI0030F61168